MDPEFEEDLQDPEYLSEFIKEWNESRLDMFALTQPNEVCVSVVNKRDKASSRRLPTHFEHGQLASSFDFPKHHKQITIKGGLNVASLYCSFSRDGAESYFS